MKRGKLLLGVLGIALGVAAFSTLPVVNADALPDDFNLLVTPSPLVATVKPGTKTQLELKIRNGSTGTENLKIEPRSFTFDSSTGKVDLNDTTPPTIASWISFSQPKFTVRPGEWFSDQVILNIPKDAGFSYSFALIISRQSPPTPAGGTRALTGSLAVFTLVNIDRPDAKGSLEVSDFSASKHLYEYLPATISVRFHNSGNVIMQPHGNIFIQKGSNARSPLATLTANETNGYVLPGTARTFTATWSDGFPVYQAVQNSDGSTKQKLVWNWAKLSQLRIGHYTAHLVAVYNQGGRDVPIEGTVSFWVFPWKILLVPLVVLLLVLFAVFMIVRNIVRGIKRRGQKRAEKKSTKPQTPPTTPDSGTGS